MKIDSIEGQMALVDTSGVRRHVSLMLLGDAQPGEYVLVHAGFAIQRIDPMHAEEIIVLKEEIKL